MKKLLLLLVIMFASSAIGQTAHLLPITGSQTLMLNVNDVINVCDDGGPNGDYSNACDGTLIITAPAGQDFVLGGTYITESGYDSLSIYDGDGVSGTLLGKYAGRGTVHLMSLSAGESITVRFTSDGSDKFSGFTLEVRPRATSEYKITYDLAGGALATANRPIYTATTPTFTLNNPAKSGYEFTGWTLNGETILQRVATITMGAEGDLSFTANFDEYSHVVNFVSSNTAHGTVAHATAQTVAEQSSITPVTATLIWGYTLLNWTVGGVQVSTSNPLTNYVPTGDATVTANFVEGYMVTYESSNEDLGTVSASLQAISAGSLTTSVTATAITGYTFVNWTVTSGASANAVLGNAILASFTPTSDVSFTANFESVFAAGDGTEGSPYQLSTLVDLEALSVSVNAGNDYTGVYLKLTQDIDASNTGVNSHASNNSGAGFDPIGSYSTPFNGHLNGAGFEITNLYINRPNEGNIGLIGRLGVDGTIDDLGIVDGSITGSYSVGGLVGMAVAGSRISDSYATGEVESSYDVGGLVGYTDGLISYCFATGNSSGNGDVGGLVGEADDGVNISHSYATGAVSSTGDNIGGLVGYASDGVNISHSYAIGAVAYAVTFDVNGGTGTLANQGFNYGESKALSANTYVAPSGHSFSGWSTSADGAVVYADKAIYTSTQASTLYAVWELESALEVVEASYKVTQMVISPNPVSRSAGEVTIYFPQNIVGTGTCTIYDAQGNRIDHQDVNLARGTAIRWDLCNEQGRRVATGGYLAILQVTDSMGMVHFAKSMIGVKN